MATAREHGVTATPAWLVDGAFVIPGVQPAETIERWVRLLRPARVTRARRTLTDGHVTGRPPRTSVGTPFPIEPAIRGVPVHETNELTRMQRFWSWLAVELGKRAGLVAVIGLLLTLDRRRTARPS